LVTSGAPLDTPAGPTPESRLGPDWVLGEDGLRFRRAARVILLDAADRLLLIRGHDVDRPERSWWFTVGGGIDAGESARSAAVREVHEETGLVLDPADLVGPVFTRSALFDFFAETCRQDEQIFFARIPGSDTDAAVLRRDGWTELEVDVLDEVRWWSLDALRQVTDEVFPEGLADLVRGLLPQWDGVTRHL
jgi:8-oxo-dGTP pyrophosphatase MutT (NUDIX family)